MVTFIHYFMAEGLEETQFWGIRNLQYTNKHTNQNANIFHNDNLLKILFKYEVIQCNCLLIV